MFRVKICGVTTPDDARLAAEAGADPTEIRRIAAEVGLDAIQLHGHLEGTAGLVDPPATCAALADMQLIRAVRLEADGLAAARRWLAAAEAAGARPAVVIVDASTPRTAPGSGLGGTGAKVDWAALAREAPLGIPLVLAGGLDPDNVAEAIRITSPSGVDTASGVESSPGRKDPNKVRAFTTAARHALDTQTEHSNRVTG